VTRPDAKPLAEANLEREIRLMCHNRKKGIAFPKRRKAEGDSYG